MNKPYARLSLTLAGWLIVATSLIFLGACNSGGGDTAQVSPSVAASPSVTSESPTKPTEEAQADPVTAGMTGANRPGTDPLDLLQSDQVKQELKLTDDQVTKIIKIRLDFRKNLQSTIADLKLDELKTPEEKSQKLKEAKEPIQKQVDQTRTEIGAVLTPDQLTRFKQITLQIYGFGVLSSDQFTKELNITEAQQKQIEEIREQMAEKMRTSWVIPPSDKPEEKTKVIESNRKVMEKIVKDSNEKALAVLTPEQQKKLKELEGAKFEYKPSPPAAG